MCIRDSVKADGLSIVGGNENSHGAVRLPHGNQLVTLVHPQGADAVIAQISQRIGWQTLHGSVSGHHEEEPAVILNGAGVDHGLNPVSYTHLDRDQRKRIRKQNPVLDKAPEERCRELGSRERVHFPGLYL